MNALTLLFNMDDTTLNFFLSAWNQDQKDFSLIQSYQSDYPSDTPQFRQGQAENNQLDYFSTWSDYQARNQLGIIQSNGDLDLILEASDPSQFDKGIARAELEPMSDVLTQNTQMQSTTSCDSPTIFHFSGLGDPLLNGQSPKAKLDSSATRPMTEFVKDAGRRTSIHYSQIAPTDSLQEDPLPLARRDVKTPTSTRERDHSRTIINQGPKVKKSRKRKLKETTEEKEEGKRKRFLERNRVAAHKCRKNKKKSTDDLQSKAHFFSASIMEKKAMQEELKQEILQLKSLFFIHSRSCIDKDVVIWIERESEWIRLLSQANSKQPGDAIPLSLRQGSRDTLSPMSLPSSIHGDGISDAMSQPYTEVTIVEDVSTLHTPYRLTESEL